MYVPTVACWSGRSLTPRPSWHEVDKREDRDPHDVDEVPVEPGDLDLDSVRDREPTAQIENPQGQEPEHANRDVGAVDPREHEEGGAEQVLPEGQPLMREVRELVGLEAEKDEAEGRRPEQPPE